MQPFSFSWFALSYLALVDDERKPKAGATHRVVFGAFCGLTIAAIYNSVTIGYVLGILVGGILGYTRVLLGEVRAYLEQKGAAFIIHSCQRNKGVAHRNRFPVANIESTF